MINTNSIQFLSVQLIIILINHCWRNLTQLFCIFPASNPLAFLKIKNKIFVLDRESDVSPNPILNRTQRRFTMMLSEDHSKPSEDTLTYDKFGTTPNLSSYTNSITDSFMSADTQSFSSFDEVPSSSEFNESSNNSNFSATVNDRTIMEEINPPVNEVKVFKYCRVNFDFRPESKNELGCFNGEYLKIQSKVSEDWIECVNYYNKIGLVPVSFVTFLEDDSFARELFENQTRTSTTSLNTIQPSGDNASLKNEPVPSKSTFPLGQSIQPVIDLKTAINSSILRPTLNIPNETRYERSASSSQVIDLKAPDSVKNRSLTPEVFGEITKSNRKSGPKPPIPPKPKVLTKTPSNFFLDNIFHFRLDF
jgi:hypothetical protein